MSKVKLKIRHKLGNEEQNYIVKAIKDNDKYIYNYEKSKITIIKSNNQVVIINNSDIINEIYFDSNNSYGIFTINNEKIKYEVELIKLTILDKIIEIDYKIDTINKFMLEELND